MALPHDVADRWRSLQQEYARQLVLEDDVPWVLGHQRCDAREGPQQQQQQHKQLQYVGGLDISFYGDQDPATGFDRAVVALVVLELATLKVVYERLEEVVLEVPYVSGFLGFREWPSYHRVLQGVQGTPFDPQVLLVDGCGVLHHQGCGSASQLGLLSGYPTIGVAKTLLAVDGLQQEPVEAAMAAAMPKPAGKKHAAQKGAGAPGDPPGGLKGGPGALGGGGAGAFRGGPGALGVGAGGPGGTPEAGTKRGEGADNATHAPQQQGAKKGEGPVEKPAVEAGGGQDAGREPAGGPHDSATAAGCSKATRSGAGTAGAGGGGAGVEAAKAGAGRTGGCVVVPAADDGGGGAAAAAAAAVAAAAAAGGGGSGSGCSACGAAKHAGQASGAAAGGGSGGFGACGEHVGGDCTGSCSSCHERPSEQVIGERAESGGSRGEQAAGERPGSCSRQAGQGHDAGLHAATLAAGGSCLCQGLAAAAGTAGGQGTAASGHDAAGSKAGRACTRGVAAAAEEATVVDREGDGATKGNSAAALQPASSSVTELAGGLGHMLPLVGDSGRLWSAALCCRSSKKPIFVSVGHRLSLDTAVEVVARCCRHRIPEPIRQADLRSRDYIRRQLAQSSLQPTVSAVRPPP